MKHAGPEGVGQPRWRAALLVAVPAATAVVSMVCIVGFDDQTPMPPPRAEMAAASSKTVTSPPWPAPRTPADETP